MVRWTFAAVVIVLGIVIAGDSYADDDLYCAACTGSPTCSVCSNCSRCAHCKAGGTCGVCAPGRTSTPPRPVEPTPPKTTPRTPPPDTTPKPKVGTELLQDSPAGNGKPAASQNGVTVYFSPNGGCTEAIVSQIERARKEIKVQAYRLTSPPVAKALLAASKRGVDVQIILDKAQQSPKYSDATFFVNMGIKTVMIDPKHAISHNKVMILDGATVITGSFNFSEAAEKSNAENLVIIEGAPQIAEAYLKNFADHLSHAVPYKAPIEPFKPGAAPEDTGVSVEK